MPDTSLADVRKRGGPKPPPPNPNKEGTHYDVCPVDACVEVDRNMKIGGQDGRGENYLDAAFFNADRSKGGCGSNWVRTTKQGTARNERKGIRSKWPTQDVGRYTSTPSAAFRSNYDCAFQRCGCPIHTPLWAAGNRLGCNAYCGGHA